MEFNYLCDEDLLPIVGKNLYVKLHEESLPVVMCLTKHGKDLCFGQLFIVAKTVKVGVNTDNTPVVTETPVFFEERDNYHHLYNIKK